MYLAVSRYYSKKNTTRKFNIFNFQLNCIYLCMCLCYVCLCSFDYNSFTSTTTTDDYLVCVHKYCLLDRSLARLLACLLTFIHIK